MVHVAAYNSKGRTHLTNHRNQAGVLLAAVVAAVLLLVLTPEARGVPAEERQEPNAGDERAVLKFAQDSSGGKWAPVERGAEALAPDDPVEDPVPLERRRDEDPEGNPYVAGELNVVYEPRATTQAVEAASQEFDARVKTNLPEIDSQTLSFPEVKSQESGGAREDALEQIRQELENDPAVEAVSYNYVSEMQGTPNDQFFGSQWGLSRINAPQAWDITQGNGALISIIDSGIDLNHPDVVGKAVAGFDYLRNDPQPEDESGHGTHVAGIAAAFTNNGIGVAGTSPNSPIIVQKVCNDALGCPNNITNLAINEAADYVNPTYGKVKAINLSLGGCGNDPQQEAAINRAVSKGVVVVVSAGNKGEDRCRDANNIPFGPVNPVQFPAAYPNSLTVGAVNIQNAKSDFSSFGYYVKVAAPGGTLSNGCATDDDIASTYPRYLVASGYEYSCGTSMAAPFVTGVAGLLASQGLNSVQIRNRIISTATDLGPAGRDDFFGAGLVNARAAVAPTSTPPPVGGTCAGNTYPFINKLSPRPGQKVGDRTPRIRATVVDRQQVLSKRNVQLYLDGRRIQKFFYNGSQARLFYQVKKPMRPGWHRAKIVATDRCGFRLTKWWRFKVTQR
jgi:thermitase